jgi:hypothetical protein
VTTTTSAGADLLGGTAPALDWAEAAQLAAECEALRVRIVGLSGRVARHYGAQPLLGQAIDAGQTAAAGLLGMRRLLQARDL